MDPTCQRDSISREMSRWKMSPNLSPAAAARRAAGGRKRRQAEAMLGGCVLVEACAPSGYGIVVGRVTSLSHWLNRRVLSL